MSYLKQALPLDQVCEITILSRKEPVQDKFDPAKRRFPYVMSFNGVTYDHEATETENGGGLANMQVNETVHAKKVLNKFGKESVYWSLSSGAESRGLAQPVSNLQADRNKEAAKEYEQARAEEKAKDKEYWSKKDIAASLGMLLKIAMGTEESFEHALAQAKKWRPLFTAAVNEQYMLDVVGANKESPDTSVKVPLPDEVKSAFGEDPSTSLPQAA